MKPNDVYRVEQEQKATSTDTVTLEGDKVEPGQVVCISFMAVSNLTTANKTVRLGYDRNGDQHWFKRLAAGASGYGTDLTGEIYLVEGEKPIAQIESPTTGDELRFYVRGVSI